MKISILFLLLSLPVWGCDTNTKVQILGWQKTSANSWSRLKYLSATERTTPVGIFEIEDRLVGLHQGCGSLQMWSVRPLSLLATRNKLFPLDLVAAV